MTGSQPLTAEKLRAAFAALDRLLEKPVTLVMGGGSAMTLAYRIPVRTTDVHAYPTEASLEEIIPAIRKVARQLHLSPDWINPHFEAFAHVLPGDYASRLRPVFTGAALKVMALGVEDLLVMKCFAGREKDVSHARALLKRNPDLAVVERRITELLERRLKGAQEALDFFDELSEATG
jgi:hypothetical protein